MLSTLTDILQIFSDLAHFVYCHCNVLKGVMLFEARRRLGQSLLHEATGRPRGIKVDPFSKFSFALLLHAGHSQKKKKKKEREREIQRSSCGVPWWPSKGSGIVTAVAWV